MRGGNTKTMKSNLKFAAKVAAVVLVLEVIDRTVFNWKSKLPMGQA